MRKINKIIHIAVIFMIIEVFLMQCFAYALDASKLRVPMGKYDSIKAVQNKFIFEKSQRISNEADSSKAVEEKSIGEEELQTLITVNKNIMDEALKKLEKEIQNKKEELTNIFYNALRYLSDGDISVDRIKYLLEERENAIFKVIGEIREMRMREELLNDNIVNYIYLTRSNSPDTALCYNIKDCLKVALIQIGLTVKVENTKTAYHSYCVIFSSEGEIAIDVATGQFRGTPEIIVAFNRDYKPKIEAMIEDNAEIFDAFLERLFATEAVFFGLRSREVLRAL